MYRRGGDFKYYCPVGWRRYGIRAGDMVKNEGWNVVYHGTTSDHAKLILSTCLEPETWDPKTTDAQQVLRHRLLQQLHQTLVAGKYNSSQLQSPWCEDETHFTPCVE